MNKPLVSRGPMGLAAAICAGGVSVGLFLAAFLNANTKLAVLAVFAALPLYMAGLGAGALAGFVASVTGILSLYMSQPSNYAVLYAMLYAIPAVTLIRLALRHRTGENEKLYWYPEGKLLTSIVLYPCILFLFAAAAATTHPGGLLDLTMSALNQHATDFAAKFPDEDPEMFRRAVASASGLIPTFAAYLWIMLTVFTMAAAQRILKKQEWNLRENFSLQALHLPNYLIYAVAATGLAGALAPEPFDYIGKNLALILGMPFFFVGLAVIHAFFRQKKYAGLMLFGFYVLMILESWIALFIAALGVIDQWVDFRQRIVARNTTA